MGCFRLTVFVVLPLAIYCKLVAQYNDGDMEVSNQEVNSEGDQTNPVSGIVRYVVDYPDDEIETANQDENSKIHQTQSVAGIARDAVQSFAPIIRQTNSNSTPCDEEFILKSENLRAPENVILGRYQIGTGKYNGTYNNKVLYYHETDHRTSQGFYMYWMSDLGGYWMIGTEPGRNYGVAYSRDCLDTACPASYVCQRKWNYYYNDDWIEDPSLMPDIEPDHWGGWAEWGQCSATCDFGNQTRTRICNSPARTHGGGNCSSDGSSADESRLCYNKGCPVDCHWSGWTFGPCSKSCGTGERLKFRSKTVVEADNGSCQGAGNATESCNTDSCPVCNGVPTTDWDCCSSKHPCGNGGGDCDTDEECKENLYCGMDICAIEFATNSSGWSNKADCCIPVAGNVGAPATTTTTVSTTIVATTTVVPTTTPVPSTTTAVPTTTTPAPTTTTPVPTTATSAFSGWSRYLSGSVSETSSLCTSYKDYQRSLIGKSAKSVTISAGSTVYTCNNALTAHEIMNAFAACTANTCSSRYWTCNGESWRIGGCGKGGEIQVGSNICSCSGKVTIRPCIGHSNWGGNGTTCGSSPRTLSVRFYLQDGTETITTTPATTGHCGSIRYDGAANPPSGWTQCYIDQRDTSFHSTKCSDIVSNANVCNGGTLENYGCWHGKTGSSYGPSAASNSIVLNSCKNDKQHSSYSTSSGWPSSTTTFGICIKCSV